MTSDMACKELVEVVSDYLEGVMPAAQRRRFEAHLDGCPYCTEYVEQMRAVGGALSGLDESSIAPEQRGALLAAFRGWHRG
jgi:anti-sigma factor RsiW